MTSVYMRMRKSMSIKRPRLDLNQLNISFNFIFTREYIYTL